MTVEAASAAVEASMKMTSQSEDKTVFDSDTEFTVKHPLHSQWQFWFDPGAAKMDKNHTWEDALIQIHAFNSVEEFWGLYNNIIVPSQLSMGANYYLFKQGIKPAWEDEMNAKGGKWSIQLPRRNYNASIDALWLHTMLAAIGETLESPSDDSAPTSFADEITGVLINSRKAFYRINIWTRSSSQDPATEARLKNIGVNFKKHALGFGDDKISINEKDKVSTQVEFSSHEDSADAKKKPPQWVV